MINFDLFCTCFAVKIVRSKERSLVLIELAYHRIHLNPYVQVRLVQTGAHAKMCDRKRGEQQRKCMKGMPLKAGRLCTAVTSLLPASLVLKTIVFLGY